MGTCISQLPSTAHGALALGVDEVTGFIITSKYLYLFLDIYNLNVSIYADV